MTTLLSTPRTAHFPGMSNELDQSFPEMARATSSSFHAKQSPSAYATTFGGSFDPSSGAANAMFRFLPQTSLTSIETNSCPPEGPTYPVEFDADLTSSSAAMLGYNASSSSAITSDLTDSGLSFPELPASLLDEAPEYEYSTHTRVNVFEVPQGFGEAFGDAALGLAPDGSALLPGSNEYGLWSAASDQSNSQAFQPDYLYQQPAFETEPNALARSGVYADAQNDGTPVTEATSTGQDQRRPPLPYSGPHSGSSERMAPSDAPPITESGDVQPSVLFNPAQSQDPSCRDGPEGEDGRGTTAGPSRTPQKDALELGSGGQSAAFGQARPVMYHRASEDWSQLRRPSNELMQGNRGPVVPSQVPGRGRLMSWQAGRAGLSSPEGEWQGTMPEASLNGPAQAFATSARNGGVFGQGDPSNLADFGHAAGPGGNPLMPGGPPDHAAMPGMDSGPGPGAPYSMAARNPHPFPMHPQAQRHHPYGMPLQHNGHFVGGPGMHGHPHEMINILGDALDASIDAEGVARCPYPNCNKTFAKNRSYNLKAHLRSHSQMKPFACAVCPRAFSRKHDLERHARVHSGDKPYICEICGKGFPRSDALRRHWRVEKECGEKAAQLEAGQPFGSVMGEGHFGHERSDLAAVHHHFNEQQAWLDAQRRRMG